MASSPITSWQINGETMETVTDFFLGSKITLDSDCSHTIQRCLLLGRKAMKQKKKSVLKSRDITLLLDRDKDLSSQSYGLSRSHIQMWELDDKKAECQRTGALELCWRRLLRVPWTARRSNQSDLREFSPEYSFEGLILKLQYFGYVMQRTDSLEKTLMVGKIESRRRG